MVHRIYNRYEVDPSRLVLTALLLGLVPSLCAFLLNALFGSLLPALAVSFVAFYAALISSVVLYRLSPVHPLAKYPGPTLAKITKFYGLLKAASGKHHEWHKKYGCSRILLHSEGDGFLTLSYFKILIQAS